MGRILATSRALAVATGAATAVAVVSGLLRGERLLDAERAQSQTGGTKKP